MISKFPVRSKTSKGNVELLRDFRIQLKPSFPPSLTLKHSTKVFTFLLVLKKWSQLLIILKMFWKRNILVSDSSGLLSVCILAKTFPFVSSCRDGLWRIDFLPRLESKDRSLAKAPQPTFVRLFSIHLHINYESTRWMTFLHIWSNMCHPLKLINKISSENKLCMTLLLLVFMFHLNVILISVLPRGNCESFYSSWKLNSNLRARSSWQCDTPSLQWDNPWWTNNSFRNLI